MRVDLLEQDGKPKAQAHKTVGKLFGLAPATVKRIIAEMERHDAVELDEIVKLLESR